MGPVYLNVPIETQLAQWTPPAEFKAAGAIVQVQDRHELVHAVRDLTKDEALRAKIAGAAREVIARNVGATQRTVDLIAANL